MLKYFLVFYFLCIHFNFFLTLDRKKEKNYLYFGIVIVFVIDELLLDAGHITHIVILCVILVCDCYSGLL